MPVVYDELVAEVDRILGSPYPVLLKPLHNITRRCSGVDVEKWACSRRCQIKGLAACLLEAIRQWPYTLDILVTLAHSMAVRDALLDREPTLLHTVLARASQVDDLSMKYTHLAVVLLSHALSDSVALPSTVHALLAHLVEEATRNPSVLSIEPVYLVLRGTSGLLMGVLSNEALHALDDRLTAILRASTQRTADHSEDHCLTLYCLATMKQMAAVGDARAALATSESFYDTQELLASARTTTPKWNAEAMRMFFDGGAHAQKTLRLLALRAVEACTARSGKTTEELLENLNLSSEILYAIPVVHREEYCRENASVRNRLQQKALTLEMDSPLRLSALIFIWKLSKSEPVGIALRRIVINIDLLYESGGTAAMTNDIISILDGDSTRSFVSNVMQYLTNATSSEIVSREPLLVSLLEQLSTLTDGSEAMSSAVCATISSQSFPGLLKALLDNGLTPQNNDDGRRTHRCKVAVRCAFQKVCSILSKLLLRCLLSSGHTDRQVPTHTATLLLELHTAAAASSSKCHHQESRLADTPATFERTKLDEAYEEPMDWRVAMREQLQGRIVADGEKLERIFAQACAALEVRCENVEQPLRDEKERGATLQRQYESICQAHNELEAQVMDSRLHYESLEAEKDGLISDLDAARNQAEKLGKQVKVLEGTLEGVRESAERELKDLKQTTERADLLNSAKLAKKTQELEDVGGRLTAVLSNAEQKQGELSALREELTGLHAENSGLKTQNRDLNCRSIEDQEALRRLETEQQQLVSHNASIEMELQTVKAELSAEKVARVQELEHWREHAKQDLEAAKASHEEALNRLVAQHRQEISELEQGLATSRYELRETQERHAARLEEHCNETAAFNKKIDRLQSKCKHKDEQIAEARSMRNNLMAAMGLGNQQTSLPDRPRPSGARSQMAPDELDTTPPTPSSTGNVEEQEGGSFTSNNTQSGPTPKRAKRKSLRVHSPGKPRMSISARSGGNRLQSNGLPKRLPLLSLSVNKSPRRALPKTPIKMDAKRDDLENFDASTFDDGELFEGTQ